MLILVGVTINFALNGGIINKAKTASLKMQQAADREELQMAIVASTDYITGEVVRQDLVSALSSGWNVSGEAPYTCISPNGNSFTVAADGTITDSSNSGSSNESQENTQPNIPNDLELYILGANKTGRQISEIMRRKWIYRRYYTYSKYR